MIPVMAACRNPRSRDTTHGLAGKVPTIDWKISPYWLLGSSARNCDEKQSKGVVKIGYHACFTLITNAIL
jgi:hypothetical protein